MSQYDYLRKKGLRSLTVSTFFGIFFFFLGGGCKFINADFLGRGVRAFPIHCPCLQAKTIIKFKKNYNKKYSTILETMNYAEVS